MDNDACISESYSVTDVGDAVNTEPQNTRTTVEEEPTELPSSASFAFLDEEKDIVALGCLLFGSGLHV